MSKKKYETIHTPFHCNGNAKYQLGAITEDLFKFEEAPYFRLKVLKENQKVVGLQGLYEDGRTDHSPKDKS